MALIALRLLIGWHFFKEGTSKLQGTPYSSGALFQNSKGPLAPLFRRVVWDPYGMARLDRKRTESIWAKYRNSLKASTGDDKTKKEFDRVEAAHRRQLRAFFEEIHSDLGQYRRNVRRLQAYRKDRSRTEVTGLNNQITAIERNILGTGNPWIKQIDEIWTAYEADMRGTQFAATGKKPPRLRRPNRRWYDTQTADSFVPYFDAILGILLVLGLFTRTAAWTAAGFLAMIIASQWPGVPGAIPTYYQAIECVALVTLARTGAGRFGSVDVLLCRLCSRCCRRKEKTQT